MKKFGDEGVGPPLSQSFPVLPPLQVPARMMLGGGGLLVLVGVYKRVRTGEIAPKAPFISSGNAGIRRKPA